MTTEFSGPARPYAGRTGTVLPRVLVMLGLGLPIAGCEDADLPPGITKKAVSFDQVPAPLVKAAQKSIAKVDFKEAWQNIDAQGNLHSYEIRGRQASDGKIREVRVSLDGKILESE